MLTDEEAEAIRKKVAEGWRGPVLLRRPIGGGELTQQLANCRWIYLCPPGARLRGPLKRADGVDLVTSHVVREVIERGLDLLEHEFGRK